MRSQSDPRTHGIWDLSCECTVSGHKVILCYLCKGNLCVDPPLYEMVKNTLWVNLYQSVEPLQCSSKYLQVLTSKIMCRNRLSSYRVYCTPTHLPYDLGIPYVFKPTTVWKLVTGITHVQDFMHHIADYHTAIRDNGLRSLTARFRAMTWTTDHALVWCTQYAHWN